MVGMHHVGTSVKVDPPGVCHLWDPIRRKMFKIACRVQPLAKMGNNYCVCIRQADILRLNMRVYIDIYVYIPREREHSCEILP